MKLFYVSCMVAFTMLSNASAQTKAKSTGAKPKASAGTTTTKVLKNAKDSASYALGMKIAQSLAAQKLDKIDIAIFTKAMTDAFSKKPLLLNDMDAEGCINDFVVKGRSIQLKQNKEEGKKFLTENAKKPGVVVLPNGLQYTVLKQGTDTAKPTASSKVKCHYKGTLISGKTFDSSIDRGEPATFPVSGVIQGWQQILPMMTVGSKWRVFIPAELGYGDGGAGADIEPGATLIFEIELLSIEK